ncbi:hypothetical protein [Nocardioides sp. AE5]|uniref:hypothetical protein n=1 Tax=Nocardioides sp. AE5 TaxID=2962573 RepID=UPI0028812D75|nr:hypothetical protein [Nocardioides sp. AE5]MDT0202431.1 hypothetical protein [Nocardioides sp. AE5]
MPEAMRPGDVVVERYRLIDLLNDARGARFWLGWDSILARHVAMHIIADDDARADELRAAAKRSATVHDPRLLRVLDIGTVDERCYVVSEWGEGMSLNHLVSSEPMSPRRAAWFVGEIAGFLTSAHAQDVAHGRLVPEMVMIDDTGAPKVIGFAVDAALHGLPEGTVDKDVQDLAGLLYCALTGKWPGPSNSTVASAPREHGRVLRPRQVRAGVPRMLDTLCEEVLGGANVHGYSTASIIAAALHEYVGDPAAMAEAEAAQHRGNTSPRLPPIDALVLAPDPTPAASAAGDTASDATPGDDLADGEGSALAAAEDSGTAEDVAVPDAPDAETPGQAEPARATGKHSAVEPSATEPSATERPAPPTSPTVNEQTVAGTPVFYDEIEDVGWMDKESHPAAPPPPPFEEIPAKPLFAPDPPNGRAVRNEVAETGPGADRNDPFWPFENDAPPPVADEPVAEEEEPVPGRTWMRSAWILAVVLVLGVVLVYALNQGSSSDQGPAGGEPSAVQSPSGSDDPASEPYPINGASDLDPFGNPPEENPDRVDLAIDGDPSTAWPTQTYRQQFGPGGLKPGVGIVVDLGGEKEIGRVNLRVNGDPTGVSVFVVPGNEPPTSVDGLEAAAEGTSSDGALDLEAAGGTSGRWVIIWVTELPSALKAEIAEIQVYG